MRKYLAEFIATFGLVFAGAGAIVIDEVTGAGLGAIGVGIAFGLIVMIMIYAVGHISGAHINPAVTLAFAVTGHFPSRQILPYWAAQIGGAISAALVLLVLFGNVASLGATIPSGGMWQSFLVEVILTFFLMFVITAMATDSRAVGSAAAIAIGATVGLEALFAGPISGASMNPARSIGPALVSGDIGALGIYIAGPIIGALLGALVYKVVSKPEA